MQTDGPMWAGDTKRNRGRAQGHITVAMKDAEKKSGQDRLQVKEDTVLPRGTCRCQCYANDRVKEVISCEIRKKM